MGRPARGDRLWRGVATRRNLGRLLPAYSLLSMKTIFQKIIAREIPAKIEHEDDHCVVIHDIQPQAPVHMLVIPKRLVTRLSEARPDDQFLLGHLLLTASTVARKLQLSEGYRVVINNGPFGGESVPHLHVHVLGRRQLTWPPG